MSAPECVCGDEPTTKVRVDWADGARIYRYCDECAHDIVEFVEGAEILP